MEEEDGDVIKCGQLWKREHRFPNTKRWVPRWFSLSGRTVSLTWYNSKKDHGTTKRKGFTNLTGCTIKKGTETDPSALDGAPRGIGCCFTINQPDSTLYLCAEDEEDMGFWMETLTGTASGSATMSKETVLIQEGLKKTGVQEISPDALSFDDEVIGKGASGIVKRGLWLNSTEVAVKVLKNVPEFTDKRDLISFYQEIETLSKLRHNNIVQMYGFCKKENSLCLVTEYVRGGNLADCLEDDSYDLDLLLQIELALNIARGMVFLHNMNVIHRDLKPANILIESWEEGKVKVCDFGISKVVKKNEQRKPGEEALGSPQYAAPELNQENHDNKVDVFSFAIILWEIAMRQTLWPELKFGSQFAERYQRGERPDIPDDNPFKRIIEKCWTQSPSERIPFMNVDNRNEAIYPMLQVLQREKSVQQGPPSKRNQSFSVAPKKDSNPAFRSQSSFDLRTKPNDFSSNGLKPAVKAKVASPPPLVHSASMSPPAMNGLTQSQPSQKGSVASNIYPSYPQPTSPLTRAPAGPNSSAAKTDAEARIWKLFATKNYESWENFSNVMASALQCDIQSVQKLKFVFDKDGVVEKSTWEQFIIWFTPLDPLENMYQTTSGTDASGGGGYDINNILSICTPNWFHSFLSSAEAQKSLKGKEDGTFLFRFSTTNPGCYALTVSYANTVGHWRISCEKKPFDGPLFFIDGRQYKSLSDIVDTHRLGKEPLTIKAPKPGNPLSCFLKIAHARQTSDGEETNEYYQNVNLKR